MPHDAQRKHQNSTPIDIVERREALRPIAWGELHTLPKRDYLIKGLLDKAGLSVLFGPSNSGKSFFALDLALTLARGRKWRDRRTRQGSVVYIAAEGGLGLVERSDAYKIHNSITGDVPFFLVPKAVDMFGDIDAGIILDHIKEIKPALVVVDTLAASFGAGNENLTQDMNQYVDNVQTIRAESKAHCLIVHHCGKDESKGSRGAYALTAATDTEIEVIADEDGNRTAAVKKQRDGITGDEFHFRLEVVDVGQDEDGDIVTSCVVVPADHGPGRRQKKSVTPKDRRGLQALQECLVDQGEAPPDTIHFPANVRVVSLEAWKDIMRRRSVLSDDINTARTQYRRIHLHLSDMELIAENRGYVWLVQG